MKTNSLGFDDNADYSNDELVSVLFEFSRLLATVRDRDTLGVVLSKRLKELTIVKEFMIAVLNPDDNTQKCFLIDMEASYTKHPDFQGYNVPPYPIDDGVWDVALYSEEPVTFRIKEIIAGGAPPPYIVFWNELGMEQVIGTSLRFGDEYIGVLWIQPNKVNYTLLKGVASQLAISVANILALNDITKRESEKALLLSLSNDLTKAKEPLDILNILWDKVRLILPIHGVVLALVNDDKKTYSLFFDETKMPDSDLALTSSVRVTQYPVTDAVFTLTGEADDTILRIDISDLEKISYHPNYISLWRQWGFKNLIRISLHSGNDDIGFIWINSTNNIPDQILRGICSQISIALSNIFSYNDIQRREAEKTLLLSFSSEFARIRNKSDLAVLINQQMKGLRLVKKYAISVVGGERGTHRVFLFDDSDDGQPVAGKFTPENDHYPSQDGFFDQVLKDHVPVHIDVEKAIRGQSGPSLAHFWKDIGLTSVIGIPLRVANEDLGVWWLQPLSIEIKLLQALGNQIAIAIANIIANEKIEQQLHQISSYKQQLEDEKVYLQEEVRSGYNYTDIIGKSQQMGEVYELLQKVSGTTTTVLILGETGTGKELIARAIHNTSNRKDKLLVKVNCAAIPSTLIESELFGHEKGSFTGAVERRIGKFELANRGTLFLDEIGEMPLDMQAKLLRAIQEKEIERVGGKTTIKTDVRIIAATNRNLQQEVAHGRFRSDLYYRLNVFPITIPGLRERKEDIPVLTAYFIEKFSKNARKKIMNISTKAMQDLMSYSWPGNVRELEHQIERTVLLAKGDTITDVYLNSEITKPAASKGSLKTLQDNEREHIVEALRQCAGKVSGPGGAAELLNIKSSTLQSRMQKLGIVKDQATFSLSKGSAGTGSTGNI
jgi:formate hydrogenlyase transcriptional activator